MIRLRIALPLFTAAAIACGPKPPATVSEAQGGTIAGTMFTVRDTILPATIEASGIAAPVREATLGTKLMGNVTEVLVHEGQQVSAGEVLARLDAREMAAKGAQTDAAVAEAEAMYKNALAQTERIRALYADSAAPKAMLDDAEAGLARAEAGVRAARAAGAEVQAVNAYAEVRAPFAGTITKRFVDPGAFVAPGAPIIGIQDASQLRVTVTVAPSEVRHTVRGSELAALIENEPAVAVVEGVVPASGGALYTVNALVDNASRRIMAGSAATLLLSQGTRAMIVVPAAAIVREGDLTGVRVRTTGGTDLRWVQIARESGGRVEVLSGLRAGDVVEVPAPITTER